MHPLSASRASATKSIFIVASTTFNSPQVRLKIKRRSQADVSKTRKQDVGQHPVLFSFFPTEHRYIIFCITLGKTYPVFTIYYFCAQNKTAETYSLSNIHRNICDDVESQGCNLHFCLVLNPCWPICSLGFSVW